MEIEFEGATLVCEKIEYEWDYCSLIEFKNLKPGDTYIGKRNTGWHMSTVSGDNLWELTRKNGYIYGEGNIYPYNIRECLKVLEIK